MFFSQNDRISVSCECLLWDSLTWTLRAFWEPWKRKEERSPSAQLLFTTPELLECPQGIAFPPTTPPWIWATFFGGGASFWTLFSSFKSGLVVVQ